MSYVHDHTLEALDVALTSYSAGATKLPALISACVACNMSPDHDKPVDWASARLALRMVTGD